MEGAKMVTGGLLEVGSIVAIAGAVGVLASGLFNWLTAKTNGAYDALITQTKKDITALNAEVERFKAEKRADIDQKRLDIQANNAFQSNLLQQIKLQQEEIAMLRSRCNELENTNLGLKQQVGELQNQISDVQRQLASGQIVALPGGRK